jgi:hypothetical protein
MAQKTLFFVPSKESFKNTTIAQQDTLRTITANLEASTRHFLP